MISGFMILRRTLRTQLTLQKRNGSTIFRTLLHHLKQSNVMTAADPARSTAKSAICAREMAGSQARHLA